MNVSVEVTVTGWFERCSAFSVASAVDQMMVVSLIPNV